MKILIDTHIFLWYVTNNNQLSDHSKMIINERENFIYLIDRIIIAQAMVEKIPIISYDEIFNSYQVKCLGKQGLSLDDVTVKLDNKPLE